jgi:hypothetical protein
MRADANNPDHFSDTLNGGLGDDTYDLRPPSEARYPTSMFSSTTGGIDTVLATSAWTLGAGFENLDDRRRLRARVRRFRQRARQRNESRASTPSDFSYFFQQPKFNRRSTEPEGQRTRCSGRRAEIRISASTADDDCRGDGRPRHRLENRFI